MWMKLLLCLASSTLFPDNWVWDKLVMDWSQCRAKDWKLEMRLLISTTSTTADLIITGKPHLLNTPGLSRPG